MLSLYLCLDNSVRKSFVCKRKYFRTKRPPKSGTFFSLESACRTRLNKRCLTSLLQLHPLPRYLCFTPLPSVSLLLCFLSTKLNSVY